MEDKEMPIFVAQSSNITSTSKIIKKEFIVQKFTFQHSNPDSFYRCSWSIIPHWLFILIRVIITIYLVSILLVSIIGFPESIPKKEHRPWAIYLTNWSFFLLTMRMLSSTSITILNTIYHRDNVRRRLNLTSDETVEPSLNIKPLPPPKTPLYIQFDWLLHSISCPIALLVTIAYFSIIFPAKRINYLSNEDINLHMMNTIVMIIDLFLASFPVNILHFIYVEIYGILYLIFSAVYWSLDKDNNVIYAVILDWNDPEVPVIFVFIFSLVIIPLFVFVIFGLYRLRCFVSRKYI